MLQGPCQREEACPRWDLVSVQKEARPAGFSPFGLAAADAGAAADRSIPRDPTNIEEGLRPEAPRFDFQIQVDKSAEMCRDQD